jgi:virginiamycin B lyase
MQRLIYIIAICTATFGFCSIARSRSFAELIPTTTIHIGKTADWVAITSDSVWVGSTGPNAVHRIDRKTNKLIATVKLPGEPCAGLATGFGSLWVPLCADPPVLSKVDLSSNTLTSFPVTNVFAEGGVTTSTDSVWLVVDKGSLARIDPRNGKVRQIIRVPSGSYNPHYSAKQIWITRTEGAEVTAIDAASGAITTTVHTGPNPRFVTDGAGAIWTLNQGDGSLTRIDMKSRSTQTIALRTPGHGGDISFGGGSIWTTMRGVPLSATDVAKGELRCQWNGSGGDSLSVSDDAIWITDYNAGTIARIELKDALAGCLNQ